MKRKQSIMFFARIRLNQTFRNQQMGIIVLVNQISGMKNILAEFSYNHLWYPKFFSKIGFYYPERLTLF